MDVKKVNENIQNTQQELLFTQCDCSSSKEYLGLICYIYQNIMLQVNLNNNLIDVHASMSSIMSCESMSSLWVCI